MEREHKKKQEALTLEDTKEQIANLETKLTNLKEEKHQLFHTLKKVWQICLFKRTRGFKQVNPKLSLLMDSIKKKIVLILVYEIRFYSKFYAKCM